jgi:hypothetical protein
LFSTNGENPGLKGETWATHHSRSHKRAITVAGAKEAMAHRHLVLAYAITLVVQFGYAGWVGLKYRAMRKLERAFPAYPSTPR